MKKHRRLKKMFLTILIIICLGGIIYSGYNIFFWKKSVDKNKNIDDELKKAVTITEKDNSIQYNVEFERIKKQNPDAVAYLRVNDTNIDYIVVKGTDNSYYLNHNFNKEYNVSGWIFADFRNNFDETDKNIVIYGHNMNDGSMFGTLKKTLEKDWYQTEKNHEILLITENGLYQYEVFSTYQIKPEDYYINTVFNNDNEYSTFLKTIKERSIYDYKVDVSISDKVLTLSSCTIDGKKRVVLHAKLI